MDSNMGNNVQMTKYKTKKTEYIKVWYAMKKQTHILCTDKRLTLYLI